jgi:glycerol kinase
MQFQADLLNVPVIRPKVSETTALGAAYAAGLAIGYWMSIDELRVNWQADQTWHPTMAEDQRERLYHLWKKAVTRTFDWVE